jgi:hypothetical protein
LRFPQKRDLLRQHLSLTDLRSYDLKKPRNDFVVEYKGARRKLQSKPKSIWGGVDLRSYADGDDDLGTMNGVSGRQGSSTASDRGDEKALGSDNAHDRAAIETSVTHEPRQALNSRAAISTTLQPAKKIELNESRPDRAGPSAASEVSQSVQAIDEPTKRGPKSSVNSADHATEIAPVRTKSSTRRTTKIKVDALEPIPVSGDDEEDLRQLELENATLRKLLAEKLRSENAFLRERLRRA